MGGSPQVLPGACLGVSSSWPQGVPVTGCEGSRQPHCSGIAAGEGWGGGSERGHLGSRSRVHVCAHTHAHTRGGGNQVVTGRSLEPRRPDPAPGGYMEGQLSGGPSNCRDLWFRPGGTLRGAGSPCRWRTWGGLAAGPRVAHTLLLLQVIRAKAWSFPEFGISHLGGGLVC